MGYPFPLNKQAVSLSFPLTSFLFAISLFLVRSLTLLSLNCSPPSKSMRSWYGWLRISSWRWPTIQEACTILEGWPTRAVVIMMIIMTVVMRRIRRRHLATNQGRGNAINYLQSRHIGIQHTTFSFLLLLLFFISFSKYLNLVWDKRVVLKNIFLHLCF